MESSGANDASIVGMLPGFAESQECSPLESAQERLASLTASRLDSLQTTFFACFMLWNQTPLNCSIFNCWIEFQLEITLKEEKIKPQTFLI